MSSIYGALFAGVSGLFANGNSMASISDNIANVNTVGYKGTQTRFSTLVTNGQSTTSYSPGGVQGNPFTQVDKQGLIQASTSPTDVAITGQGFFVVTTQPGGTQAANSNTLFTRAGNFTSDKNGNLFNAGGYFLQGYKLDPFGNVLTPAGVTTSQTDLFANLQTVNLTGQSSVARATANITAALNLPPTAVATPAAQTTNITTYDALGNPETMVLTWNATATLNQWTVNVSFNPTSITTPATAFTVNFNNQGQLINVNGNTTPATSGILAVSGINFSAVIGLPAGVAQPQTININFGTIGTGNGTTQVGSPYAVNSITQDGVPPAALTGVGVDNNGFITATFANGLSQKIYRLAVATYQNADGLQRINGNAYSTTSASGNPFLRPANTGASGAISPSSLENSTVDLSQEFTNMIIVQRAYNAAARVITTADQMLDEATRLKQ
ncbi:MAG: flagellar hook protein FlgE [Proteobacteria bacterium]|nr:flagellar hook protein FlgE [Pseudomonadota bacterium]MBI3498777.1 flagellar hook protein FlgE [Pseudomonadota bacterium]